MKQSMYKNRDELPKFLTVMDLAARRIMAEETAARCGGNSLFVSIHMNAFPQPQYSGMQVWYGPTDPRSAAIAEEIQTASRGLMPHNTRQIKEAGSNIYLLDRIKTPAVLVECGFLSNPEEAECLSDEAYRRAVAAVIFCGITPYLDGIGEGAWCDSRIDKQKEILEKFEDCMNEMHSITEHDAFSYGFRLGVQLMAEALLLPLGEDE